jgi:uncharacterized protein (TIGR03000 family)
MMRQKGTERVFVSPPLKRGEKLTYRVKARWKDRGRVIVRTKSVKVRPGEEVTLNLRRPPREYIKTRVEELPRP